LLARDQTGLTQERQEACHARVQQTQSRSAKLRQRLERETAEENGAEQVRPSLAYDCIIIGIMELA
jgi:hypothetical protein